MPGMISRRTTKTLSEVLRRRFGRTESGGRDWVDWDRVYDWLYERDFDAPFCNAASHAAHNGTRPFEQFVLRLHTGETIAKLRVGLNVSLELEGQAYIRKLSEEILREADEKPALSGALASLEASMKNEKRKRAEPLARSLELDGYVFRGDRLLHVESAILDVEKQHSALVDLARILPLGKLEVIEHHLELSETHYAAARWDDAIGNARKFLECCLQESAALWSTRILRRPLEGHVYESASEVRQFLLRQGLLSEVEFNTIRVTWGLLSATGNHPHIAANDQARMLRQVALIYSEFVMLRLKGAIAARPPIPSGPISQSSGS